jgi:hypothetical protein
MVEGFSPRPKNPSTALRAVPLPEKSRGGIECASPSCQRSFMSQSSRSAQAAGFILAISILAGAVAGVIVGQPSIGFLAGLATGLVLLLLFWLNERRR